MSIGLKITFRFDLSLSVSDESTLWCFFFICITYRRSRDIDVVPSFLPNSLNENGLASIILAINFHVMLDIETMAPKRRDSMVGLALFNLFFT